MAVDSTTISRFLRRDQCRHEDDRHGVQRPIRFKLRGYFEAVSLRHDKIDNDEVRLETARRFQSAPRIIHCTRDVIPGCFEKQTDPVGELRIVVDDQDPWLLVRFISNCSFISLILIRPRSH